MNKERRASLNTLHSELNKIETLIEAAIELKTINAEVNAFVSELEDVQSQLACLKEEEQEYYDNMPENFQDGEKWQAAERAMCEMDQAYTDLGDAIQCLHDEDANVLHHIDDALTAIDNATE